MGIIGELGSGKTLSLVYLALRNHTKRRPLFANFKLIHLPYTRVHTPDELLRMSGGFAALDELWVWADSRLSGSHKNKFVTMILSKSRKRDIHLAYTAQYFKSIDVRIRTVTDFIALPQLNSKETICTLKIYSNPAGVLQQTYRFRTAPIFKLYDTHEEVDELDIAEFLKFQKKKGEPDKPKERKKKEKDVIYEEED
jgi:hypothetical protein